MKTDYWKLAQAVRWGFYILFGTLAILGIVAICLGHFLHIITTSGCAAMAYMIAKHWLLIFKNITSCRI